MVLGGVGILLLFFVLAFVVVFMKPKKQEEVSKKKNPFLFANIVSIVLGVLFVTVSMFPSGNLYPNIAERLATILMAGYLPVTILTTLIAIKKQSTAWSVVPIIILVTSLPLLLLASSLLRG